jgi:hypothetical protein
MRDIEFSVSSAGECLTPCESMGHMSSVMVGSVTCTKFCKFFVKHAIEQKIISCDFNDEKFYDKEVQI